MILIPQAYDGRAPLVLYYCGRYLQSSHIHREAIRDLVSSGVVDWESFRSSFVCCKKPAAQAIRIRKT
jgi:hypothetical protein